MMFAGALVFGALNLAMIFLSRPVAWVSIVDIGDNAALMASICAITARAASRRWPDDVPIGMGRPSKVSRMECEILQDGSASSPGRLEHRPSEP
jgi:hypothetical protein